MPIAYDASRKALFRPEARATVFTGPVDDERLLALEGARLAYCRYEEDEDELGRLRAALAIAGLDAPTVFHHAGSDGQGFGASNGRVALLAFRGTQPDRVGDLVSDANFVRKPWDLGAGSVHAGFRHSALGLWPEVQAWLQQVKGQRVVACGHSLGAAIATLLAVPAGAATLITIGSPRVGDATFASTVREHFAADGRRHERITHCCDTVTRVPPTQLGFAHVEPARVYIDRHGRPVDAPPDAVIDDDRDAARRDYLVSHAFRRGTVLVRELADHAPINYLRAYFP